MPKQVKTKKRVAEHGEVFTAEREVKAMCDLVKQETERIDSRFLEPACGNGNFLAEILTRKLTVVRKKYKKSPYDWERNSLLALGSLYGVDLLIDNCIECRQRLFEMWDKEYKAICKKECNDDTREAAKFILSRNIVCGNALTLKCVDENGKDTNEPIVFSEWTFPFNDALMQRSDYTFAELLVAEEERPKRKKKKDEPEQISLMLDEDIREAPSDEGVSEEIFNMKFDVIISNPPYQLETEGAGKQAKPIYQNFVRQAKKLKPQYIIMITPSRWFAGGMGLDDFRNEMLSDNHIKAIVDYSLSTDCFPGVDIAGGVSYFLWNKTYNGRCTYTYIDGDSITTKIRNLNEHEIFVRDNRAIEIVNKVVSFGEPSVGELMSSLGPFGLGTAERGEKTATQSRYILLSSAGRSYIEKTAVKSGLHYINKWKVVVGKATSAGAATAGKDGLRKVIATLDILEPGAVCTFSYFIAGAFDRKDEAINYQKYLATKFVRFLLLQCLSSINISKDRFRFVPQQDFKIEWTDEMLYTKYSFTDEEVALIESMIKPMSVGGDTDAD